MRNWWWSGAWEEKSRDGKMSQTFICWRAGLVPRALSGSFSDNCAWSSPKRWQQLLALAPDICLQYLHSCIQRRCCRKHEQVIDFARLAYSSPRLNWTVVNLTPRCGSSVIKTHTALLYSHVGAAIWIASTNLINLYHRVGGFPHWKQNYF